MDEFDCRFVKEITGLSLGLQRNDSGSMNTLKFSVRTLHWADKRQFNSEGKQCRMATPERTTNLAILSRSGNAKHFIQLRANKQFCRYSIV